MEVVWGSEADISKLDRVIYHEPARVDSVTAETRPVELAECFDFF